MRQRQPQTLHRRCQGGLPPPNPHLRRTRAVTAVAITPVAVVALAVALAHLHWLVLGVEVGVRPLPARSRRPKVTTATTTAARTPPSKNQEPPLLPRRQCSLPAPRATAPAQAPAAMQGLVKGERLTPAPGRKTTASEGPMVVLGGGLALPSEAIRPSASAGTLRVPSHPWPVLPRLVAAAVVGVLRVEVGVDPTTTTRSVAKTATTALPSALAPTKGGCIKGGCRTVRLWTERSRTEE